MRVRGLVVVSLVLSGLLVAACAETRDPQVVSIKQADDKSLTCQDIQTEYKTNTEVAASKISKNNSDDTQDIIVGGLIWPGLADFKNADGIEGNALLDRNVFLRELASSNGCEVAAWPLQPVRYD
ncbi:hypothetical protein O4H49_02615 [Kiloniella laminariae]|uniref:Lipoprotein n=1 Tax=Kiloniella laminariae TaxID=454162 RepID=A0ABT4LEZ9_9PROT|nr:hypothetical protein [Kiloniella laminariae]MCZ4279654.1 hypothetical protein [Kiloniella laminariae]